MQLIKMIVNHRNTNSRIRTSIHRRTWKASGMDASTPPPAAAWLAMPCRGCLRRTSAHSCRCNVMYYSIDIM